MQNAMHCLQFLSEIVNLIKNSSQVVPLMIQNVYLWKTINHKKHLHSLHDEYVAGKANYFLSNTVPTENGYEILTHNDEMYNKPKPLPICIARVKVLKHYEASWTQQMKVVNNDSIKKQPKI